MAGEPHDVIELIVGHATGLGFGEINHDDVARRAAISGCAAQCLSTAAPFSSCLTSGARNTTVRLARQDSPIGQQHERRVSLGRGEIEHRAGVGLHHLAERHAIGTRQDRAMTQNFRRRLERCATGRRHLPSGPQRRPQDPRLQRPAGEM